MTVPPKRRFDVFKRDDFTCVYCGRTPPAVTLEADHVVPRAEGGDDDIHNLVTSCMDCNRGKGATPLTTAPAQVGDLAEKAALIRDREEQVRAYHAALAEAQSRRDADFDDAWNYWFELWVAQSLPRWAVPFEATLRKYLDLLGLAEVKTAMEITRARFNTANSIPPKYLAGILRNRAEDQGV